MADDDDKPIDMTKLEADMDDSWDDAVGRGIEKGMQMRKERLAREAAEAAAEADPQAPKPTEPPFEITKLGTRIEHVTGHPDAKVFQHWGDMTEADLE